MFPSSAKRSLLFLGALATAAGAFGQRSNREASIYSRYGIGDLRSGTQVGLRAMGGAATGYASSYIINTDNPATYSSLKLTTYEGAGEGSRRNVTYGGESVPTGTATLSYLRVGIPLGKNGGMAFGLQPESRVYYNLRSDTQSIAGLGRSQTEYFGEGGTNYAFVGLSGKLKGFSLGVNFGYLFGTITNTAEQSFFDTDTARAIDARFVQFRRIGGIYARGGAYYSTKLGSKLNLGLGATFALSQDVTARRTLITESVRRIPFVGVFRDTISNGGEERGVIRLPLSYGFGAHLTRGDQWGIALDYRATQWSNYRTFGATDSVTSLAYRFGIGGEFMPKPGARDFASRVTYRIGFAYGRDFVSLRGENIDYYSATLGASLPFRRSQDRIHTAFEFGRRGTEEAGLARESFVRFSFGLSLVDRWFVKRRYE